MMILLLYSKSRTMRLVIFLIRICASCLAADLYSCASNEIDLIKITNSTLYFDSSFANNVIGNYLTAYYNARGFAKALGICFEAHSQSEGAHHMQHWMAYLPNRVCYQENNLLMNGINNSILNLETQSSVLTQKSDYIKSVCKDCNGLWLFPHECKGFWMTMQSEMRSEIGLVIDKAEKENSSQPLYISKHHAVIQLRCLVGDSFLCHSDMGPLGFSFYKSLRNMQTIVIVGQAKPGICETIRKKLTAFLRKNNPQATILYHYSSVLNDFAILTRASVLYIDRSTFGLMAGLVSNAVVYSPTLFSRHEKYDLSNFHYLDTPLLIPSVAQKIKLSFHSNCTQRKDVNLDVTKDDEAKILKWLKSN